jgi:hypothetical protein
MSRHTLAPLLVRAFIACSPDYHNRRALMEALGSIFLDTIEGQREYYYFECPAMTEIFDDGVLNQAMFRRLIHGNPGDAAAMKALAFTHIIAGGDDVFVDRLLAELNTPDAVLVRLA